MRLDLNLLRPLDALLHEGSVTRAARRLGLSQPACSAALARLRVHFGDPLLIRVPGSGMQLTPLAARLRGSVADLMDEINTVLGATGEVDLATLDREFSFLISTPEAEMLMPTLVPRLATLAPAVRVRLDAPTSVMRSHLSDELRRHDVVVLPTPAIPAGAESVELYPERWACVIAEGDGLSSAPSLAELGTRSWATSFDLRGAPWSPVSALENAGLRQAIKVRAEGFLELFSVIGASDLVALVPQRLAERYAARSATRWVPAPAELAGPFGISMAWNGIFTLDAAHAWLRERVLETTAPLRVAGM